MIVNYKDSGWEVITQRAHGLLAAQLAQRWKHAFRNERWTELLIAIAEHDDAQVELERDNLLTPQGGPLNFKMKAFEQRHCTQTMDFALSKSRYIALLCRSIAIMTFSIKSLMINRRINTAVNRSKTFT